MNLNGFLWGLEYLKAGDDAPYALKAGSGFVPFGDSFLREGHLGALNIGLLLLFAEFWELLALAGAFFIGGGAMNAAALAWLLESEEDPITWLDLVTGRFSC